MYSTISSRLTAHFNVDGNHLNRYLKRKRTIVKSFCEDLILHDQILIPTQDFLTVCGLVIILSESGLIKLLEMGKIKFIRTRHGFGFASGKGTAEIGIFSDPQNKRPLDAPLDKSINAGLNVIDNLLIQRNLLFENIINNTFEIDWSTILKSVKQESVKDLKYTKLWNTSYESGNPNYIKFPKQDRVTVRVIGVEADPYRRIDDALLLLTLYNSDIFLANKFNCQNISPYFPIGDLLTLKQKRINNEYALSEKLWYLLKINGVPDMSVLDFSEGDYLNSLIEICDKNNAASFRNWFHEKKDCTENEIVKEYIGFLKQIPWYSKLPVKVLRFIITTSTGFIPVLGQATSLFDSFVFEKLFKNESPKYFIDDLTNVTGSINI